MGGALSIAAVATHHDIIDAAAPFYGVTDLKNFDLTKIKVPV